MALSQSEPLVSVIVPTYNYSRFIHQMLESLHNQTYRNWECIVVDDGSTDNTAELVADFAVKDRRVKLVRQENRRQAAARNSGLRLSCGQYIQFLDADDLIESRKLELQVEFLESHPDVDIVYGDVRFFTSEDPLTWLYTMWGENKPWQPGISGHGHEILLPLLRLNSLLINTPLARLEIVRRVAPFDEELPPVEDWDFWVRCAIAGAYFQYIGRDGTMALVRSHATSSSKSRLRLLSSTIRMRRKLQSLLVDENARRLNSTLLGEAEGRFGVEAVIQGQVARGVCQLAKAVLLDDSPRHKLKWLTCALLAPVVGANQFKKLYVSSITTAVIGRSWRNQI